MLLNLLLGFLFSAIISTAAYWRGSLARSGALGALALGTIVFAVGGLSWAIVLVAFFVSSSLLSHYKARIKEPLAEKFQKGHRRDLGQVLANGGAAGLCALAFALSPRETLAPHPFGSAGVLFIGFIGALATVTADTWATELGVLSASPPRLISTGRVVAVGTSGGVTLLGTLIALCGAFFIGIVAIIVNTQFAIGNFSVLAIISLAGILGSLVDSFLGATAQAIYFCDHDQTETESRVHRCGTVTRRVRGWGWLDNDWVNFISSVAGSAIAMLGYWVIGEWF